MRIITWNVHRARKDNPVWDFLLRKEPDLVLLQEVGCMPSRVTDNFDYLTRPAINEAGSPQKFQTGVLIKGKIGYWVVVGDFNSSETFDREWQNRNGKRFSVRRSGDGEMLRRMRGLGFTESLRKSEQDPIIPTFRQSRGTIRHQIDHLFVSNNLIPVLEGCKVGDEATILGKSLSDHLPIIADFTEPQATTHTQHSEKSTWQT
jgi:exonuclease III